MVPLAQALKDHGHEVAFATGRGFGPAVHRSGFVPFPAGIDFDGAQDIFKTLPGWEAIRAKSPGDLGIQQLRGFVQQLAPRMADDLIEIVETWRPDAIVRDHLEFGGYIAA